MPVFKTRPKLHLEAPVEVRPGTDIDVLVTVWCKRPIEVEWVRGSLRGTAAWNEGGEDGYSHHETVLVRGAELSGPRTFPVGHTKLPARVSLPATLPPSYRGTDASVEYELSVQASVDWWPDARASFQLAVTSPHVESPAVEPALASSFVLQEGEPYAELSLPCRWTRAGDAIRGAVALSNVRGSRYRDASIVLRRIERHRDRPPVRGETCRLPLAVDAIEDGEMIPFELRLHPSIVPSHDGPVSSISYELALQMTREWGTDFHCVVPYQVLPRSPRTSDAPPRNAPPSVGSARLMQLWEYVGAQHGMRYDAHALHGRYGETSLTIFREHRGRAGVFSIATLAYPHLHLELSITRERPTRVLADDIAIGEAAFDDTGFLVQARDAGQTRAFLTRLARYMRGGTIAYAHDTAMSIELKGARQSAKSLGAFVAASVALARAVEEARGLMVPPTGLERALPSWLELAARLGSRLEIARMRIDGAHEAGTAAHASVELRPDAPPRAMWLAVAPASPIDAEHTFAWTTDEGPDALDARFSGTLGELVRVACAGACDFRIEPRGLAVALPRVLGLDPSMTPALAAQRIERLAQIAAALRGREGAYR